MCKLELSQSEESKAQSNDFIYSIKFCVVSFETFSILADHMCGMLQLVISNVLWSTSYSNMYVR